MMNGALIVSQHETDIEAAEREALHYIVNSFEFRFFSTQKFLAGGGVEKQITHFNCRAPRMSSG